MKGWRDRGVNPAAWKGNLRPHLAGGRQAEARANHGAMPYADVPAFMGELAGRRGIAALALRFVVLTAARSGEVRGMTWGEVSDDVWRIPAERMKGGREHRVPLTAPAMAVLEAMAKLGDAPDRLVFPGTKPGKPMSDMTLTAVLETYEAGRRHSSRLPVRLSRLGQRTVLTQVSRCARRRWRTRPATRWRQPTTGATTSPGGAS